MSYITEVAATAAFNSLVHLYISSSLAILTCKNHLDSRRRDRSICRTFHDNDRYSFCAVFPNLASLDLTDNNFTQTPPSIYIHDSLKKLRMKGNPLASLWFTQDQSEFLSKIMLFVSKTRTSRNQLTAVARLSSAKYMD